MGNKSSVEIACMRDNYEEGIASHWRLVDGIGSGSKTASEKTTVLTSHIPVQTKPACIFRSVTANETFMYIITSPEISSGYKGIHWQFFQRSKHYANTAIDWLHLVCNVVGKLKVLF